MKIIEMYSHLNGEEHLIVHNSDAYQEIKRVIDGVDAQRLLTKTSKEKTMRGKKLYSPTALNDEFRKLG